jgi:inorganic pyrophosphatase
VGEIEHFFERYKEIEPGKESETGGFAGADAAQRTIDEARQRYVAEQSE